MVGFEKRSACSCSAGHSERFDVSSASSRAGCPPWTPVAVDGAMAKKSGLVNERNDAVASRSRASEPLFGPWSWCGGAQIRGSMPPKSGKSRESRSCSQVGACCDGNGMALDPLAASEGASNHAVADRQRSLSKGVGRLRREVAVSKGRGACR